MALENIRGLPVALGLDGSEYVPIVQAGVTKRAAIGLINSFSATGAFQAANTVFAGPVSGAPNAPSYRVLVPADLPGNGISTFVIGDLLYASSTTALTRLGDVATGSVLTSGGVGAAPAYSTTPILGASGTLGSVTLGNATSGLLTLQPVTGALGTVTLSLPAASDTLVGKATTDTFTNKTLNTAATGNVFQINGTGITAVTGTGAVVLSTSPSLTTPSLGVATATSINKVALTAPATSATLTIADGKTLTVNASLTLAGPDSTTMTFPATSSTVAGLSIANVFTALQTITIGSANTGVLASTGYSLTGSSAVNMLNLAGTWNTSGTPTAVKLNITNTASNAASLLMDLQSSGSSVFAVGPDATYLVNAQRNQNAFTGFQVSNTTSGTAARAGFALGTDVAPQLTADAFSSGYSGSSTDDAAGGSRILASGSGGLALRASHASGTIRFYTGSTERLDIGTTGNVLIGTGLLQFLGATASFPALKRSTTTLQARLADDSAYAGFEAGLIGAGGGASAVSFVNIAAGTTTVAPLTLTSGTNLTSASAGVVEYDGVQDYFTIDISSGRGARPVEQYCHLTADGSAITTIANFFGATSNISLVASAYYIIDIYVWFLKTTADTVVWTLTNSAAPTSQNIYYEMSPITGIVAPPGTATMLIGQVEKDSTAAKTVATGTLSTAVEHYAHFKIWLQNGTGTSLKIQATATTGSVTPRLNSYWIARRMSPNNIGTLAA